MPRSVLMQTLFLLWFKDFRRLSRSMLQVFLQTVLPVAFVAMIIAVFLTAKESGDPKSYTRQLPGSWVVEAGANKVFYYMPDVTDAFAAEVLKSVYDGDEHLAATAATRFTNATEMNKAIYPPGKGQPQADIAFEAVRDAATGNVSVKIFALGISLDHDVVTSVKGSSEAPSFDFSSQGVMDLERRVLYGYASALGNLPATATPIYLQRYTDEKREDNDQNVFKFTSARGGTWGMLSPPWIAAVYFGVFAMVASGVVREKEYRLRQSLETVGLSPMAYYFSWLLRTLILSLLWIAGLTVLLVPTGVFYKTNAGLLMLFLALASLATASVGFVFATLFSEARLVAVIGVLVHGACVGLGVLAGTSGDSHAASAACLLPGGAVVVGVKTIYKLENRGDGWTGSTFATDLSGDGLPSGALILFLLVLDIVVYTAAAWYLDQVIPGALGVTRKWYFPFTKQFWRGASAVGAAEEDAEASQHQGGACLLKVRGLGRKFGSFTAVKHVDLELYQGEVLSLLGHNGAGKSTTIRMLTGQDVPSTGTITAGGAALQGGGIGALRDMVGVCPQHDVLFDGLTAREHVLLVGAMKGIQTSELGAAADGLLDEVGMSDRAGALATALSGGQKRKLAVAMAFLGGSRLVFLDEPTSGMDPVSRRSVWSVVRSRKSECAVVLTTHFMDEADLLGDRTMILHRGEVRAEGHSLELKTRFGTGYSLILTVDQSARATRLHEALQSVAPAITLQSQYGGEVTFKVPTNEERMPELLAHLERNAEALGVRAYGLSMTTLEDVFLRLADVGPQEEQDHPLAPGAPSPTPSPRAAEPLLGGAAKDIEGGAADLWSVLTALLYKRLCYARRDVQGLAFQVVFPVLFFVLAGILYHALDEEPDTVYTLDMADRVLPGAFLVGAEPVVEAEVRPLLHSGPRYEFNGLAEFDEKADVSSTSRSSCGLRFTASTNATAYFNASATYSLPFAHSAWARAAASLPGTTTFSNFPPNPGASRVLGPIMFLLCTMVGSSFIPSAYAAFIVKEREVNVSFLQFASGVPKPLYWLANFLWDCLQTFASSSVSVAAIAATMSTELSSNDLVAAYVSMLLFCFTATPFSYLCAHAFDQHSKAQMAMAGGMMFLSLLAIIPDITVMMTNGQDSTASQAVTASFVAINPLYALVKCFGFLTNFLATREYLDDKYPDEGVYGEHKLGFFFTVLLIQAAAFFVALWAVMLPWRAWGLAVRRLWQKSASDATDAHSMREVESVSKPHQEDPDVVQERAAVEAGERSDAAICVNGLAKQFGGFAAVHPSHWSIGAGGKGECFGLLGANGAGKTTSVKMLTCEVTPTGGDATLINRSGGWNSVISAPADVQRSVGLCPQFDALLPELTGREWLTFFASVKGIPRARRTECVEGLLNEVGIMQYADRPCGKYSGGNRRKLSLAIALMGKPPVVFLDEPSTGVDPKARRGMWDLIRSVAETRALVLTSHSMEEVDALCDRVGIMSQGRLIRLGTPQHLRSRSGQGYTLQVSVSKESHAGAFVRWATAQLPGSTVAEQCGTKISIALPDQHQAGGLAALFATLRDNKKDLHIEEYAISQTTLEQVFLDTVRKDEAEGSAEHRKAEEIVFDDIVLHIGRFLVSVALFPATMLFSMVAIFAFAFAAPMCILGVGVPLLNYSALSWQYMTLGCVRLLTAVESAGAPKPAIPEAPEGRSCTRHICFGPSWACFSFLVLSLPLGCAAWAVIFALTVTAATLCLGTITLPVGLPVWWLTTRLTWLLLHGIAKLGAAALSVGMKTRADQAAVE